MPRDLADEVGMRTPHRHLTPEGLIAELRTLAPRAVRGRRRVPTPLRVLSGRADGDGLLVLF